MFNGSEYAKPLDEEVFEGWLESGRESKIKYNYLLVIWDAHESEYKPTYLIQRDEIENYQLSTGESLIAAYDLYSQSRIVV